MPPNPDSVADASASPLIDDAFSRLLVCPLGKTQLTAHPESATLVCQCGLRFPVTRGMPDFVVEHAEFPNGIATRQELPCQRPNNAHPDQP